MTETRRNLYVSLLILAIAVAYLVMAAELSPKGRMVPMLVAWMALVLCVLDVIAHTETGMGRRVAMVLSGTAQAVPEHERPGAILETKACLWMIVATAGIVLFGFLWATPVYVFAYMTLHGRKSVYQGALTALFTTLFVWIVFEVLMEYEVYRGLLFEDF